MLKPWYWTQWRNCNAEYEGLKYHLEASKITIKWKMPYFQTVVFSWRVFNLFLPGMLVCTLWSQDDMLGAKSLNLVLHVDSSPLPWKELWLLLTLLFGALFFVKWVFARNLLLFEESPPLLDGLVVHQSLSSMKFWLIPLSAWWFKSPSVTSSAIWLCSLFWKLSMIHKDARRAKVKQSCLCCD